MLNVYLVCAHGDIRMPEALARENIRIIAVCCAKSLIQKSQFVDEVIPITEHHSCGKFAQKLIQNRNLLDSLDGWVIFGRDDDMYQVARSELPTETKLKLLPVKNVKSLMLPGSKRDFISIATEAKINIPRTEIVEEPSNFAKSFAKFSLPVIIKSDRGAGGTFVRRINSANSLDENPIPNSWFPLVVQEFIHGAPAGVDALFRDGNLVGWIYCDNLTFTTEFGPSLTRRFVNPPALDFQDELIKFGKATAAHGFANCSFFYLPEQKRHLLFEVDMRTNAWHHFGPFLGVDWAELMTAPINEVKRGIQSPTSIPKTGLEVTLWSRYIGFALQTRDVRSVFRLLKVPKSQRSPIRYRDTAINKAQYWNLIRTTPIAIAKFFFDLLPAKMKIGLKSKGVTARVASWFAGG